MRAARTSTPHPTERDRLWSSRMVAAQGGDRAAYETLLQECVPHIKLVVRRTGIRPDGVEDAVQDILLAVHRARHTFDPGLSFTAWLSAIAHHRAVDHLRRRGRREARETSNPVAYEGYADDGARAPDEMLDSGERGTLLRRAVAELPPAQRQAVEALGLREQSLSEAAAATGRTKGALKVNLHRALKVLRQRLDKDA